MKTSRTRCLLPLLLGLFLAGAANAQTNNECTGNESWIQVGEGFPGRAISSTKMNGDFYVLHRMPNSGSPNSRYRISRWDGSAWGAVTNFELPTPVRQQEYRLTIMGYNGDIYLGGDFPSIDGNTSLKSIARWNGTGWASARGNLDLTNIYAFGVHNGALYVSAYGYINGSYDPYVLRWDGTQWNDVGSASLNNGTGRNISTLLSWNGDLYAAGSMLSKWDGTKWDLVGSPEQVNLIGWIQDVAVYNNQIYIAGGFNRDVDQVGVARWNGTNWENNFPLPGSRFGATKIAVHGNSLYMISSGSGGGADSTLGYTNIDRFDGTNWFDVSNTNGTLSFIAGHDGDLYLGGDFSESCGAIVNNIARLCDAATCGKISGTVFHDADSDCSQDQNERGLPRRVVEISPGGHLAITDANGNYSRYVDPGTYTVGLRQHPYWNQICPAAPGTHTVTVTSSSQTGGKDFGAQPIADMRDLRVSMVSGRARQGRQLTYVITYENYGTVPMNGTVHFSHDPILTFDSAQAAHSRYSPALAEWDFTDLQPDEIRTIRVWTTVPIATPMETMICSQIHITPANINVASNDDRDSVCVPVTGGYDPNDIQVTPFGIEQNGVITPRDSVLTYWVRFQNTGNDTAFKVVVVDTLSAHLDISSIRLGAASHPFSFSIDKSNVLVWTFNDILLPDSNASEPNSHGFFKFSVKLKRDLPALTEIPNQAHIYFDYNAPVATNTVVSILGSSMSVGHDAEDGSGLTLYPNPARESVTINAEMHAGAMLEVRNLLGERIRLQHYDGSGPASIDVRDLPAGTYLVTVETRDGLRTQRITVLR